LQQVLTAAASSRNIALKSAGTASVNDRLMEFIAASASSSTQSAEVDRLTSHYRDSDKRVREHMTKALSAWSLPNASGGSVETYTVSFIGQVGTLHQQLELAKELQTRLDRDVTRTYLTEMGSEFHTDDTFETKVVRLLNATTNIVPAKVQEALRTLDDLVSTALSGPCNFLGIVLKSGPISNRLK
jgi:hypothetical protein